MPIERTTVLDIAAPPPPLGPVVLDLPEGSAECHDALSCTMITGERADTGERFIVIVSAADIAGRRLGTLAQFTPTEARSFAASLLGAADQCDGGQRGAH